MNVAEQIVKTLEVRGVQFVFGLPGEENIALVNALEKSEQIKLVITHDEQAATFMAEVIGWLSDQPGVAIATLGPGALNMAVAVADAHSHSLPIIAISAQGGVTTLHREEKQVVSLTDVFAPITTFSDYLRAPESVSELVNKAYNEATADRTGASFIAIPAPFEQVTLESALPPVIEQPVALMQPTASVIEQAAMIIREATHPLIVAGFGAVRAGMASELTHFARQHQMPVATTYMAKGIIPEDDALSLGVLGFLVDDYLDEELSQFDTVLVVGVDFGELSPARFNPMQDKTLLHIHSYRPETHGHYSLAANLVGKMDQILETLSKELLDYQASPITLKIKQYLRQELTHGAEATDAPLTPVQIVHATRAVLGETDRALVDTGALKMWMARLFPVDFPNQLMFSNAMSSMAWSLPGTIAAKLLEPDRRVLTVTGDGSFHMNMQELATAMRENIPLTILVWDDSGYELIKWKMEMSLDESAGVSFQNPDFVRIAQAYGGRGHVATSRNDLERVLRESLDREGIDIIVAPVDYSANLELSNQLADDLESGC